MKFKPLAAALAALAGLTMVGTFPATAQPWNGPNGFDREAFWRGAPTDPYARIGFLQRRIDRGLADGSLSPREARRARYQLDRIRRTADNLRYRRHGQLRQSEYNYIQNQLDQVSQRLRWLRHGGGYGYGEDRGYAGDYRGGYAERPSAYVTDYDAARYYREGPSYSERRLSDRDEVYRGSDGRYYCKRSDGTTGLIVGAAAGGILGNIIDSGHNRAAGTLIGGALGALAGKSIAQSNDIRCR
jgi:hypothetical protein